MTFAFDWDIKHQFKQTSDKYILLCVGKGMDSIMHLEFIFQENHSKVKSMLPMLLLLNDFHTQLQSSITRPVI